MKYHGLKNHLQEMQQRLGQIKQGVEPDKLASEIANLEEESQQSGFWDDQERAQTIMRKLGRLQNKLDNFQEVQTGVVQLNNDLEQLSVQDTEMLQLINEDVEHLEQQVEKLELTTFLNGKYDPLDAIISIHAGQGGTEAHDWAQMLMRMYLRYSNGQSWEVSILNQVPGSEVGISTVTFQVTGDYAYGYLKHEQGTHRLVRNSPFNSAGLRQTTFAGVEVMPKLSREVDVELNESDIEFNAVRSSGAGGQSVNKVATSVRLVHNPSGISVSSSASRSQSQNRKVAMDLLKAKLAQKEQEKIQKEKSKIKGEHKEFGWSNQIRNYVLQPYKLVKDLRTNVETNQAEAVLDGDLQQFIDAELREL